MYVFYYNSVLKNIFSVYDKVCHCEVILNVYLHIVYVFPKKVFKLILKFPCNKLRFAQVWYEFSMSLSSLI